MELSNSGTNLYSKVSNNNIYSSRDYLALAYGNPKTQYYTPIETEENNVKKRSNAKTIGLITASALALFSITAALLSKKNIDIKYFEKLTKGAGDKIQKLQLNDKIANFASNIVNIKDDIWDKFANKIGEFKLFKNMHPLSFISKAGQKITNVYHKIAKKPYQGEWDKLFQEVKKYASESGIEGLEEKIDGLDFQRFYSSTQDAMNNALHQKGNRVSDNLLKKGIFNRITQGNIADEKISDVAKSVFKDFGSEIDFEKLCQDAMQAGDQNKVVNIKLLQSKLGELNTYKDSAFKKLIPKMRDICSGSAPTDILTQLFALGSLGVVVANSDTKEEKQDAVIDLGIPILTALSATNIALIKSISGAASLAFGLILGKVTSYCARGISVVHKKHNQKIYENIRAQVLEEQKNAQV